MQNGKTGTDLGKMGTDIGKTGIYFTALLCMHAAENGKTGI